MNFWDASALLPLVHEEAESVRLHALTRKDPMLAVWWGSRVECRAGLRREARSGGLTPETLVQALARLRYLASTWTEVEPSEAIRRQAEILLDRHPLRAADAFQLGSALVCCEFKPVRMGFVCLDARLRTAAASEGFELLP